MELGNIKPQKGSTRRRRRIARGISAGQGATGGKGMRGQKARSGKPTRPGFEGGQTPLYRRLPKLKHFPLVNTKVYTIINVGALNTLPAGSDVSIASLQAAGLLTTAKNPLKILGDGELSVALSVVTSAISQSARTKIEAAGGSVTLLEGTSGEDSDQ